MPFSQVLFEILSAYGTCGLSLGFESGPSVTNIATKEVRLFAFFFTDTQTHETPAASGIKPSLSVESGVWPSKVDVFFREFGDMVTVRTSSCKSFSFLHFFVGKEVSIGSADQPSYWTFHKNLQRWSLPDVAGLHDDLGTAQRVPWLPSMSKFLSVLDFGVTSGCQIPSMLQYEWPCRAARNRLEKGLWGGMRVIKGYFGDIEFNSWHTCLAYSG